MIEAVLRAKMRIADISEGGFDRIPRWLKVPKSQPGKHSATLATRLINRTNRLGSVEAFAGR
jgi:hypothetical protein